MAVNPSNFGIDTNYDPGDTIQPGADWEGPFFRTVNGPIYSVTLGFTSPNLWSLRLLKATPNSTITNIWAQIHAAGRPDGIVGNNLQNRNTTTDGTNIYVIFAPEVGTLLDFSVYKASMETDTWTPLHIANGAFVIDRAFVTGSFLNETPRATTDIVIINKYISSNKLFLAYQDSFTIEGVTNRQVKYKFFDLGTNSFTGGGTISAPAVDASYTAELVAAAVDEVNSRILVITADTPKNLTNSSPTWNYFILDFSGITVTSGTLGANIGFNYNAVGETQYIKKYINGFTFPPFYGVTGVFGQPKALLDGGVIKFICPYKGTKLRLSMALINSLTGAASLNVIDSTDYSSRISGNTFTIDNRDLSLGIASLGVDNIVYWVRFIPSVAIRVSIKRRRDNNTWDTTEDVINNAPNEILNLSVNAYGENVDRFFGIYNGDYFGPAVPPSSIIALSVSVGDTLNFFDSASVQLFTVDGPPPPVDVHVCPDIVASSACAEVKTINDAAPILTDCNETVFSESAQPCVGDD